MRCKEHNWNDVKIVMRALERTFDNSRKEVEIKLSSGTYRIIFEGN